MPGKITAAEGEQVMRDVGYEPLEPYPGWFVPWRFRCTSCGTVGATRAHGVRQRKGGCVTCGRLRGGAAQRLDGAEVAAKMRERGLEPLEPYPGAARPWRVRCLVCGDESTPKWAKVQNRGDGCKTCGKRRTADAKRVDPDVAAAFMRTKGYEPQGPYPGGDKPWRCIHTSCGREVTPRYTNLVTGQGGCVECGKWKAAAARRKDAGEAVAFMRAAQLEPLDPFPGIKHPWLCRCLRCGGEAPTTLETVRAGNLGCIPCGRQRRGAKRRLPGAEARAMMTHVGLAPMDPYPGRTKQWRCACTVCGDETTLSLSSALVRIGKSADHPAQGCEACVYEALGRTRMLTQEEAEERMRAIGMEPFGPYRGINEPWEARCLTCGAMSQVNLPHAFARGRGCAPCAMRSRADFFRKPEEQAVAAMFAAGFRPLEPYVNINSPWRSIHLVCGQEVSPRLASLSKTRGCAVCGGKKIVPGYNDLATTHPDLAREIAADDPTTFGAGSGRKVLWRCGAGHEWKAVVGSRTGQGTGCPVCATTGYNPSEAAWLYLLRHDRWDMLQIGITNDPRMRVATHARNGWEPLDIRGPMDGTLSQEWERAILRMLRATGVELAGSGAVDEPARTGSTRRKGEAWWRDDLAVDRLRPLMDMVEERESQQLRVTRRAARSGPTPAPSG